MNIVAIGDPHGNLNRLKRMPLRSADAILVTGDLGNAGLMRTMAFANMRRIKKGLAPIEYSAKQHKQAFMQAFTSSVAVMRYLAKHAPTYTIFGNVESSDRETKRYAKQLGLPLPSITTALRSIPNVHVVGGKSFKVGRARVGALDYFIDTNWVKTFLGPKQTKPLLTAKTETNRARTLLKKWGRVDILLCHQPPLHVLDKVTSLHAPPQWRGKHAGSETIKAYVKKQQPTYVICGHIHEAAGKKRVGKTIVYNLGDGRHAKLTLP